MEAALLRFGVFLFVPFLCAASRTQNASQANSQVKTSETAGAAKATFPDTDGKNPVKASPENLAEAKKIFGYDCAMCHGAAGDGKGDLAASQGWRMNDWRESSKLEAMPDNEIFDLIMKGRGRMVGEADRYSPEKVWKLVIYVRTFEKKVSAAVPKTATSQ